MKAPIRDRLLAAAKTVFRIHGFEDITVQMIADEADANISAVNYHYGSKADLHAECVARYLVESVSRMPMLEDRPDAPKEQLAGFIRWFFTRYPSDSLLRHFQRDVVHLRSMLLKKIVITVIRPEFENGTDLVRITYIQASTSMTRRSSTRPIRRSS